MNVNDCVCHSEAASLATITTTTLPFLLHEHEWVPRLLLTLSVSTAVCIVGALIFAFRFLLPPHLCEIYQWKERAAADMATQAETIRRQEEAIAALTQRLNDVTDVLRSSLQPKTAVVRTGKDSTPTRLRQ